jgi:predicted aspartyl protease
MRIELAFAFLFLAPPQVSTVPFAIVNGYTVVENVSINGHGPYRFVLDTGAQSTTIDAKTARELALVPSYRVTLSTKGGTAVVPATHVASVSVGNASATGIEVLWYDFTDGTATNGPVAGKLGHAFLSHFEYMLDYRNKRLLLSQSGNLDSMIQGKRIPFEVVDGRIVLPVRVCEQMPERPAVLDSGAPVMVLPHEMAPCQKTPRNPGGTLETQFGARSAAVTTLKRIQIGDVQVDHVPAAIESDEQERSEALLPARFFNLIYVNYPNRSIVLVPR